MKRYIRNFPEVLRIEPAGACNLRCIHCPTGTTNMNRGIMSSEIFKKIINDIQGKKIRVAVLYHGGEPLLNPNLSEMIKQIKKIGVSFVKIVSNGMLLTAERSRELIESGLDLIEFSIDGVDANDNNSIRRGANFDTVITNINALIAMKKELGCSLPDIVVSSTQFDLEPTVPEFIKEAFQGEIHVVSAMKWPGLNEKEFQVTANGKDCPENYCDNVNNTITIRWDGAVVPCCYDLTNMYVMGNILNEKLETIWNNQPMLAFRKKIEEGDLPKLCEYCTVLGRGQFLLRK
ncbi:radical SAM/SPASM domain-containing protein [Anaeromusa acidaminophila]|uniref:radical SAM/SPASM domain-containing protein n=1 Tax=Anaeromusa acidaminophila TaxID=81464 RepID=UPI00036FE55C|nr:radical SAM protein [Anaeromusa acidaminophila]